mmetsp:Transcript_10548/g.27938  ORF Transcript_10548/g.27938 Transcript_10548/m.27938 type:complete len:261 (-) Transcript_10548:8-790(-)
MCGCNVAQRRDQCLRERPQVEARAQPASTNWVGEREAGPDLVQLDNQRLREAGLLGARFLLAGCHAFRLAAGRRLLLQRCNERLRKRQVLDRGPGGDGGHVFMAPAAHRSDVQRRDQRMRQGLPLAVRTIPAARASLCKAGAAGLRLWFSRERHRRGFCVGVVLELAAAGDAPGFAAHRRCLELRGRRLWPRAALAGRADGDPHHAASWTRADGAELYGRCSAGCRREPVGHRAGNAGRHATAQRPFKRGPWWSGGDSPG